MLIKIDDRNANIANFRPVLRHLSPVLAASSSTLIFLHPQVTGGIFQSFHVVAFQKVHAGEGAVDCRDAWVWSWIPTTSGGVFCGIARAEAGLRTPQRRRFSSTSSRLFIGSAPERDNDRRLSNVPEFPESGRFEFRGFTGSSDPFSSRISSSVSSFFQMRPNACGAHQT
jgi:hypothetical protein